MSTVTTEEIAEFLKNVPMFRELKPRQLKKLAGRARVRDYDAGTTIVEHGADGIGLYIIARGTADVRRVHHNEEGEHSHTIDRLERLAFFGELSLLDDAPRSASVVATSDVKAVLLTKLDFLDVLQDEPQIAIVVLKEIAHRVRRIVTNL